jgi:uncharacterized protein YpmB
MIKNSSKQMGSAHVVIIVILVVALIGALGFIFWKNFATKESENNSVKKTESKHSSVTPKVDSYSNWQSYKSADGKYNLRYPQGWVVREADKSEMTSAFASASFAPTDTDNRIITVSNFQSDLTPKAFVESSSTPQVIDSNENSINGNTTYYHKDGDGTYINRSYAISHLGIITTISMTEMSQNPAIDNSVYVSQFDLLAKSIKF